MDLTISFACEFVLLESSFSSLNLFYDLNPMMAFAIPLRLESFSVYSVVVLLFKSLTIRIVMFPTYIH